MAEQGTPGEVHINAFKRLSELFKKKNQPATDQNVKEVAKAKKPEAANADEDSDSYITIISPGTGFPHRIPRNK